MTEKLESIEYTIDYSAFIKGHHPELTGEVQNSLIAAGYLKPPCDRIFGPKTRAALDRFKKRVGSNEPGGIGKETAKALIANLTSGNKIFLEPIVDTVAKARPIQSGELNKEEKRDLFQGERIELLDYDIERKHVRFVEADAGTAWYAFGEHVRIVEGFQEVYSGEGPNPIQLSVGYKSQLDNWNNPTGSCNVTSLAMCLEYLGVDRRPEYRDLPQFEDELYEYALDCGYSRHSPHDLAQIARDYGATDNFSSGASLDEVREHLSSGFPCILHGYFTSFGHIIVAIGWDEDGLIVHDPYGEWFPSGYRTDLSGEALHYSYNLIRRTCIPDGSFWVHFI